MFVVPQGGELVVNGGNDETNQYYYSAILSTTNHSDPGAIAIWMTPKIRYITLTLLTSASLSLGILTSNSHYYVNLSPSSSSQHSVRLVDKYLGVRSWYPENFLLQYTGRSILNLFNLN